MSVKDAHFDDCTKITGLHTQRCIAHVRSFLTKDGAQQFFFWRHRAFALGCDLADKNVTGFNIRTDVNDASLVEVAQRFFTNVRDIACDFLWPQLCITGGDFEFLDVDRSKHVVTRYTFRD